MQINDERHSAVDECLSRIAAAWGAGDAPAFAAEFTEDASYVIFAGIVSLGRAEIEKAHVPVFQKWQKGSRMSMRELHRRVSGDSVIVVTEGGIGKGRRIRHDKVQTFVFVNDEGAWRCAAFQNTKKNGLFVWMNARATANPGGSDGLSLGRVGERDPKATMLRRPQADRLTGTVAIRPS